MQSIGDQKIDVLINSAGGNNRQIYSDILNNSIEDFDEVFRLNTSGTFEVIKNIVPLMNQDEYPVIITMSSVAGQLWKGGSLPYHIAKSSESKLLDFLSKYLSEKGIRSTDLIISTVNSFYDKNIKDNSMTPEDIFSVIKFIIESPEYLTIDKIHLRHIKSGGAIA